jgi:hypothetical protein
MQRVHYGEGLISEAIYVNAECSGKWLVAGSLRKVKKPYHGEDTGYMTVRGLYFASV